MGLTFLLQSCLCFQAVNISIASSVLVGPDPDSHITEGQAMSTRWRSLTHNHISRPPPYSALLVEQLAKVFNETGSFSSTQQSIEFVNGVALGEIESIIQLSLRSELAFRVEVMSSDMTRG